MPEWVTPVATGRMVGTGGAGVRVVAGCDDLGRPSHGRSAYGGISRPLICAPDRHTIDGMATKTERFAVRLTAEQDALIRRAAEVEGTDLTNFAVTATLAHAREVLADRRLFMLDASAWSEFVSVLDRPVSHKPRLEKLFAESSIFDE